jgi:hypothetical protein
LIWKVAYFGQYLIYLIAIGTATFGWLWLIAWIAMQATMPAPQQGTLRAA